MGAVVTGPRPILRSFGGQPLETVRPDPCGVQSGVLRPRLLAAEDEHGLRRSGDGGEFDEFLLYQDIWFGDRLGDKRGKFRWMVDEPD